jgi:GT2 family glycosyltransferase
VDNCSADNSEDIVKERFPEVRFIQMGNNSGFARANNEGIHQAKEEVFLLLNSDTLVEDNAIEKCYQQFIQSDYVACGVQLLNKDRSPQISGNYFMAGSLNNLLPLPYIGGLIKWLGNALKVKKPNVPDSQSVVEVDWINGAFLMVKKATIEKAGLMDEDFFLYAEEVEWCSRLRKIGKLCIYGQYKVIHLQGATANESFGSSGKGYYNLYDRKGLQIMLSNFVRIRKQLGVGWFLFHLMMYAVSVPIFFLGSFIESLVRVHNPFNKFYQASKLAMNVAILWSYAPRIIMNRPYFYKVLK